MRLPRFHGRDLECIIPVATPWRGGQNARRVLRLLRQFRADVSAHTTETEFRQKMTPEIRPETLEHLARSRTFFVHTCRRNPDFDDRVPAHAKVIRPLLSAATEAFVWPPRNEQRTVPYPVEILSPERGRHRFDLSRDVLTGYEGFWHASAWERGSIALRLPRLPDNFIEILMHCNCTPPMVFARRTLAKCDSAGAIRYCDAVIDSGEFAFLFSASNGIELLSIFAPESELERLYRLAIDWCRPFKRWFECLPGECVNLVESGND